jgi:hypothetical protein
VISGEFGAELAKSFVMVPFDVPRRTTAIRVKYCVDRPESGTSNHTLDSVSTSRDGGGRSSGEWTSFADGAARAIPT